jgi:hypothetical protein
VLGNEPKSVKNRAIEIAGFPTALPANRVPMKFSAKLIVRGHRRNDVVLA